MSGSESNPNQQDITGDKVLHTSASTTIIKDISSSIQQEAKQTKTERIEIRPMFTNSKHFSCNLCDDKFPTAYHLDYHISSFHSKLILTGNPAALNGMDENTTPNKTTKVSAETVNPNKRKRTPAGSEKIECEQCASNIERVRNVDMLETEQSNLMQMYEECQSNSSN